MERELSGMSLTNLSPQSTGYPEEEEAERIQEPEGIGTSSLLLSRAYLIRELLITAKIRMPLSDSGYKPGRTSSWFTGNIAARTIACFLPMEPYFKPSSTRHGCPQGGGF